MLKDQVEEGEEQAALVVKELRAKTHDYEILKRDHAESVRAVQLLQQALNEQQAMLQERGLVLLGEGDEGEGEQDCDEMEQEKRTRAIVSQDTANILAGLGMTSNFILFYLTVIFRFWTFGCSNKEVSWTEGRPAGHRQETQAGLRRGEKQEQLGQGSC